MESITNKESSVARRQRIVVIGGGFAGLNFIKKLGRKDFDVTLVDKNNFHSFPPLFYQVASSGLEPASISFPFRRELRKHRLDNVRYNMGTVEKINLSERLVKTQFETIPYDKLVIAAGTTNNFFGMDELHKTVYTIKSTAEAIRCRNDILDHLEQASMVDDADTRRRLLRFVVVGGGPTGVEMAGALGEMKKYVLKREYPSISPDEMTITLVEGAPRLLGAMKEKSGEDALRYLNSLLVDVELGKTVKEYDDGKITLSDGGVMDASMVVWTAGVRGVGFDVEGGELPITRGNRIEVDQFNRVKGVEGVYALGDICLTDGDKAFPHGHPQVAQVAIQQGKNLAKNLKAELHGGEIQGFVYRDKGSMATVGRNRAVVDLKHGHLNGFFAWLTWMFIHLISLLGMRNKIVVFFNWLWAYFSYGTGLRLLIHPAKYPLRKRWMEDYSR